VLPDFDVDAEIAAIEAQATEDAAAAQAQAAEMQRLAINAMQAGNVTAGAQQDQGQGAGQDTAPVPAGQGGAQ